ncbi:hypothetical protein RI129_003006 [Pyrocoelia pectoralis]|uniref:DDE Tnp4 domain-containing protein n=1 Tax=Pyrocoelia pectoralis TaxID=417401 RepID=A0AAN7VN02_9COLE
MAGPSTRTSSLEDIASCSRSRVSVAPLEAENYFLKQELDNATTRLSNLSLRFSFEYIKNNDAHVLMYTGIPTSALYLILYETMEKFSLKYYSKWQVKLLPNIDQMLMTLMKLRLNLPHEDLAMRFNCSTSTVTTIVMTWIYALHEVLFNQLMSKIPSRKCNQACLSSAFANFRNCRIVLDCTEIYSVKPSNMEKQRLTYSSYKHRNTWKVLVGVAPNGVITYVSKAYPGSTSDKKIVEHSRVLEEMCCGDLILVDKGFLIKDLLPQGVHLNIPPFLTTPQFTEAQVYETRQIAKARIHVERAIRRIKCYNILQIIPQHYMSQISVIFQLCAALTNFQYPLIKEVEEYYA